MKIVVCIKQVPDTADIKWTENNTMVREGVESILNPFDAYALETAIGLKEANSGVTVTALSMGPPQAKDILKKAIAMGCDDAILLTDKKFAGADTQATSRTIAKAILEKINEFDLIICGQFAIDGDTAQTGPSIAEHLNIAQLTYVNQVEYKGGSIIHALREVEDGVQTCEMKLPGLICVVKCDYEPRMPKIRNVMKASRTVIPEYGMNDLGLTNNDVGIKGSPTFVSKAFRPPVRESGEIIDVSNSRVAVNTLIKKLKENNILVSSEDL